MFYKYLNELFTKLINKVAYFKKKLESTAVYHKILEINKRLIDLKNKIVKNEFIILLFEYKNNLFLKDLEKVKLYLNEHFFSKINTLYKKNLNLFNVLYITYLKNYVIYLKNNIKVFVEKYNVLEKRFNIYIENKEVLNKENSILKQNKSISYSSIISLLGSRQRSTIYAANPSLWPVFLSIFAGIFVLLFVCILHNQNILSFLNKQLITAIIGGAICISFWITTFYKEKQLGFHTYEVRRNIRLGFYIFIFTEAVCFLSLFWTFLHALLAASLNIGLHNPGEGIVHFWMSESRLFHPYWERFYYLENQKALLVNLTDYSLYRNKKLYDRNLVVKVHINLHDKGQLINPYKYPLMNTFILLTSACSLNASHTQIKMGKYLTALILLAFTILLGLAFTFIQYKEIKNCSIQFTDGIYGSCFYSLTGLHGTHVILGIFALFLCFINFLKNNYSQKRHDTYWFAILYWHFVDIIWILVYLVIYIWPSFYFHRSGIRWAQLDHNSYCFNLSQEAFESTFYSKLYRDRIKLNHNIINFAVIKLDQDNILKNNENIVFNGKYNEKADYKEIHNLNVKHFSSKEVICINKESNFETFFKKMPLNNLVVLYGEIISNKKLYASKDTLEKLPVNSLLNDEKTLSRRGLRKELRSSLNLIKKLDAYYSANEDLYINHFNNKENAYYSINEDLNVNHLNDKESNVKHFNFRKAIDPSKKSNIKIFLEKISLNNLVIPYDKIVSNKKLYGSKDILENSPIYSSLNDEKTSNHKKLHRRLYSSFNFIKKLDAYYPTNEDLNVNHFNDKESNFNPLKRSSKVLKNKNFSIFNNLENKSKIIDASNILYDYISYFNYNGIKKQTAQHAIVLNTMHYAIFQEIQTQEAYDLLNKRYKIFIFFLLSCIDNKLCFIWAKNVTPYFLQN